MKAIQEISPIIHQKNDCEKHYEEAFDPLSKSMDIKKGNIGKRILIDGSGITFMANNNRYELFISTQASSRFCERHMGESHGDSNTDAGYVCKLSSIKITLKNKTNSRSKELGKELFTAEGATIEEVYVNTSNPTFPAIVLYVKYAVHGMGGPDYHQAFVTGKLN